MTLKENIQFLSDDLLQEIVNNYESFEEYGHIGDCLLRDIANKNADRSIVVLMMERVALETYRELYNRAIENNHK
jgi:hypothetical protein